MIRGVDVSSHQPPDRLDYTALAVGHQFLIARASYGTRPDTAFREHVRRSLDAGLKVGAYLFYRAMQPVKDQFDAFCTATDAAGLGPGWLAPALDVEKNEPFDGEMTHERYAPAKELATMLRDKCGACLVYTNLESFRLMGKPEWIQEHLLWHAQWGVSEPSTPFNMPATIWQHLVDPLPGVYSGELDQNLARYLPILGEERAATPDLLPVEVDWDELRADRDALIKEME